MGLPREVLALVVEEIRPEVLREPLRQASAFFRRWLREQTLVPAVEVEAARQEWHHRIGDFYVHAASGGFLSLLRWAYEERRYGPGDGAEAPWSGQRLPKRPRLAVYLLIVVAAAVVVTGWQLGRTHLRPGQLGLFLAFLCCGAACVEATRRWGAPPTGTRDMLTAWWLPVALLLPPACALLAPLIIGLLGHWRARQGPLYWRVFTAAALAGRRGQLVRLP